MYKKNILVSVVSERVVGQTHYPNLDIITTGEMSNAEAVGVLQIAFMQMARYFLDNHPKNCVDCPQFVMVNTMLTQMEFTLNNIKAE